LVLDRFRYLIDEFENILPKERNLGMLKIDFNPIRDALIP